MPELSLSAQAVFRVGYAALLLGFLVMILPHARRFLRSERWGGYARSERFVDVVHNPVASAVTVAVWTASAICLALGRWTLIAALVSFLIARYFFVQMRWRGVARGMGAPGFMTYWLAAAVFLLELSLRVAPEWRSLTVLVLQVDLAFIMLSAGIYKLSAGYARNHGMELGMVNPEWGYWWRWWRRLSPGHSLFWTLNQLAWATEIVAAALMLVPPTRLLGAALIALSFVFIATQIRLGVLCEMVILATWLFVPAGGPLDALVGRWVAPAAGPGEPWPLVGALLGAGLVGYLALLPLAHAGLFYNFYLRRPLPGPLQRALEAYTNFFGIIIWRVFSVDVVNFFVLIHRRPRQGGERVLVSRYGWRGGLRYGVVCESIAVTSLFTTLKYYPSNEELFRERLLRYARTVPCRADERLVFEYVAIVKRGGRFEFVPTTEYVVDPREGSVDEVTLSDVVSTREAHAVSPVHEGLRPGSYVPRSG